MPQESRGQLSNKQSRVRTRNSNSKYFCQNIRAPLPQTRTLKMTTCTGYSKQWHVSNWENYPKSCNTCNNLPLVASFILVPHAVRCSIWSTLAPNQPVNCTGWKTELCTEAPSAQTTEAKTVNLRHPTSDAVLRHPTSDAVFNVRRLTLAAARLCREKQGRAQHQHLLGAYYCQSFP